MVRLLFNKTKINSFQANAQLQHLLTFSCLSFYSPYNVFTTLNKFSLFCSKTSSYLLVIKKGENFKKI